MTDQQIVDECARLRDLLLVKHTNYGNSAEKSPVLVPGMQPGAAIFVRMSDKIARIAAMNALSCGDPAGESVEDTVRDLAGYCVLWLALYRERTTEKKPFDPADGKIDDSSFFGPDGIMNKINNYNGGKNEQ